MKANATVRTRQVAMVVAPADVREGVLSDIERQQALDFAGGAYAASTKRAYTASREAFTAFCAQRQVCALPASPVVVVAYLLLLAEARKSISTLERALAAIAADHRLAGQPDPTHEAHVRVVMKGIRKKLGVAAQKKAPVRLAVLEAMISTLAGDGLSSRRDRALLLVGYAGAFRRSELVALDVADVQLGLMLTIRIRKSKTDQEQKGASKFIPPIEGPLCPLEALRAWLSAAGIRSGPLFRPIDRYGHVRDGRLTDKTVARVVKGAAARAGFEASQFAGHSLRSGFITEAASAGEQSRDIMAQSGHQSEAVMRGYIQDAGVGAMSAVRAAFGRK